MSIHRDDFEQWYSDHAEGLVIFLTMRTGDRGLAEDLTAETFERVLRARRKFDKRKASVKTWIYSIALNCLRDHARRKGAEQRAFEHSHALAGPASATWTEALEDREALARALQQLPPDEREAIALRF